MTSYQIFFSDLNEEAQRRYLKFQSVSSPEELNVDCFPIATVDKEEEDSNG